MGNFLISPVREVTDEEKKRIAEYVEKLENLGAKIYWPLKDTDQNDAIGLRICADNAKAILQNKITSVWWNGKSTGSLFDFGMAFMLTVISLMMKDKELNMKTLKKLLKNRLIILVNPEDVKETPDKSFSNVLKHIDEL